MKRFLLGWIVLGLLGACGTRGGGGGGPIPGGDAGPPVDTGPGGGRDAGPPGPGWTEEVCSDPLADLSDVAATHSSARLRETVTAIAERRYPIAVEFIAVQDDADLARWFSMGTDSFDSVLDGFEVATHEGAHIWDITMIGAEWPYRLTADRVIRTRNLENFARSEILAFHADPSSDFYAMVYLEGFSGSQGFNNLLDEYNAYVHSLASKYCTRDSLAGGVRTSAKDGILTFMYYVELYLKVARMNHPDDYAEIVGDPAHIEMILAVWDRAEFWLEITASHPELGLNDAMIRSWTYDPANLMEIEMLRDMR